MLLTKWYFLLWQIKGKVIT